jgi:hypothetical protein
LLELLGVEEHVAHRLAVDEALAGDHHDPLDGVLVLVDEHHHRHCVARPHFIARAAVAGCLQRR